MIKLKNVKASVLAPEAPKGLAPLPFQLDAYEFITRRLSSHRAAYLAADPGLGKTIVSCLLSNSRQKFGPLRVLYICPPSLPANVEAEFKKWGVLPAAMPDIVADTQLETLAPKKYDLVFVDEAHRFKNEKAKRTQALYFALSRCRSVVLLSGTPAPNSRPVELWPILKHFAPEIFGTDFFSFALRYCGAHKTPWGWRFDKFTNRAEFRAKLYKSFMIRQKKNLIDLPEKREGLLTVGEGLPPILGKLEHKILTTYSKEDLFEGRLAKKAGKESLHLGEYMRLLGTEKLKHVYPFLEHLLYETDEKILIFAHHKAVITALAEFLVQFKPVVISGATPKAERFGLVKKFQAGKTRVAILNLVAGGIGWNLTAADRVLLVEFSWRDGDNEQAGDRAHRIGRTKPVLVQYVVLKDSLDAKRMAVVINKRHSAV